MKRILKRTIILILILMNFLYTVLPDSVVCVYANSYDYKKPTMDTEFGSIEGLIEGETKEIEIDGKKYIRLKIKEGGRYKFSSEPWNWFILTEDENGEIVAADCNVYSRWTISGRVLFI